MKCFISKGLLFLFYIFFVFTALLSSTKATAQSVGGTTSGAAIYCAAANAGFVNLDFGTYTGNIIRWESSINGGISWATIYNITASQSYNSLMQSTCFRAIVQNGVFPPDSSTMSCIDIYAPSIGGAISGGGTFCISPGTGTGVLNLTGNISDTLYWQYSTNGGVSWTSLPGTAASINHPNINQNTIYWAIVKNGTNCPSDTSAQASFTFDSISVAGNILSSDTVCPGINGSTLTLTGNVGTVSGWQSSANNGSTWSPISNTTNSQAYSGLIQTTLYKAIVKNGTCNSDTSGFAAITIVPNPVNAGNDTTIIQGQSVILNGTGNGTALWTPSLGLDSIHIFKPAASPQATTLYLLTVTDNHSCVSTDSVLITVRLLEFSGFVSNLFTPNGDGINDTWFINDIQNYPDNEVFIYNIYGNLVYTKKGYTNDWQGTYNGSELPDGTYFYVLRFVDSGKINKGSVDILRSK